MKQKAEKMYCLAVYGFSGIVCEETRNNMLGMTNIVKAHEIEQGIKWGSFR